MTLLSFLPQIACRRPFQFARTEWVNTLVTSVEKFSNIQVTKVCLEFLIMKLCQKNLSDSSLGDL